MAAVASRETEWEPLSVPLGSVGALSEYKGHALPLPHEAQEAMAKALVEHPAFFATVPNIEVNVQLVMQVITFSRCREPKGKSMKNLLNIDIRDLSVMVGAASLAGASCNILSEIFIGTAANQSVVMTVGLVVFLTSRFLFGRSSRGRHD